VSFLSTARLVTFATTILFSLIVISLSANLISLTEPLFYYKFSALALSTGLMTILTVTPMFVIDMMRQGSFFSYIIVEISWLSFLWVLWLSSGSYAAWTDGQITDAFPEESSCDFGLFSVPGAVQGCQEVKAIMAFSFLLWILLMGYTITLLVLAIRSQERGNAAWTTGVRDGVIFYSSRKGLGGAGQIQASQSSIIPLSQQPPQQYIPTSAPYANPQYPQAPTSASYASPQYQYPQAPSSVSYSSPQV
jgi:hypothetical protein